MFLYLTVVLSGVTWLTVLSQEVKECLDGHCFMSLLGRNVENSRRTWYNAKTWCSDRGYSLAVITDNKMEQALQSFLYNHHYLPESVWIGARFVVDGRWRDVKGNVYNGSVKLPSSSSDKLQALQLDANSASDSPSFSATDQLAFQANYICRLPSSNESSCSDWKRSVTTSTDCYVVFPQENTNAGTTQTWFMANDLCLGQQGFLTDLSVVNATLLASLLQQKNLPYWLGVSNGYIEWTGTHTAIKTTHFESNAPDSVNNNSTNTCIAMRYSGNWVWQAKQCGESIPFVCHTVEQATSTSWSPPTVVFTTTIDPVPHLSLGGMIGIIVGSIIFFIIVLVAAVVITYHAVRWKMTRPGDTQKGQTVHNMKMARHGGVQKGETVDNVYDDNQYDNDNDNDSYNVYDDAK